MAKGNWVPPTASTNLADTQKYLEHLMVDGIALTVREFIGFWGYKNRGRIALGQIEANLSEMNLAVYPPLESGTLDAEILIQRADAQDYFDAQLEEPAGYMLTVARMPAATFALPRPTQPENPDGYLRSNCLIEQAVTRMLRNDFSQIVVLAELGDRVPLGVFSWESLSRSMLRGERPETVGEALMPAFSVELHSDLFEHLERIESDGFVLVTYRGQLSGIVTASDLSREFRYLTLPFLAVGRCERELRRVAKVKISGADEADLETKSLGGLQYYFREHWSELGWSLSEDIFFGWLNSVRLLRNSVAHFDDELNDVVNQLAQVQRLTRWLMNVRSPSDPRTAAKGE